MRVCQTGGREIIYPLLLYLDDLLALADAEEADRLKKTVQRLFCEVQFEVGSRN
jgi:hypothetical protein